MSLQTFILGIGDQNVSAFPKYLYSGISVLVEKSIKAILPKPTQSTETLIVQNDPDRQEFRRLLYRSEDQYTPRPLAVPILQLRTAVTPRQDSDLGWRKLAVAGLTTIEVEGDHIEMFKEPYVKGLAAVMSGYLDGHTRVEPPGVSENMTPLPRCVTSRT
jgi:thioesterase domain-containing protein